MVSLQISFAYNKGSLLYPTNERLRWLSKRGAHWLFYIVTFSIINIAIMYVQPGIHLFLGLRITDLIYRSGISLGSLFFIADAVIVTGILAVMILLGNFARKQNTKAFVCGFAIVVVDTGLLLIVPNLTNLINVGCHIWALCGIWQGMQATKLLKGREASESVGNSFNCI